MARTTSLTGQLPPFRRPVRKAVLVLYFVHGYKMFSGIKLDSQERC